MDMVRSIRHKLTAREVSMVDAWLALPETVDVRDPSMETDQLLTIRNMLVFFRSDRYRELMDEATGKAQRTPRQIELLDMVRLMPEVKEKIREIQLLRKVENELAARNVPLGSDQ